MIKRWEGFERVRWLGGTAAVLSVASDSRGSLLILVFDSFLLSQTRRADSAQRKIETWSLELRTQQFLKKKIGKKLDRRKIEIHT